MDDLFLPGIVGSLRDVIENSESFSHTLSYGGGNHSQIEFWLDHTQGFGAVMARMGLNVEQIIVYRQDPPLRHGPGGMFTLELPAVKLALRAGLLENAVLRLLVPTENYIEGMARHIVLDIEYSDETRKEAEELLPQILAAFQAGRTGEFGKRAALMLGMLLMEMLWAAAS